jgi:acylphosphatase
MSDNIRLSAVIHGRVQGVGFRWTVQTLARELGLTGYVANRPDGAVEVQAEGRPDRLAELEKRLHSGPRGASVTALDVTRGRATGEFSRFATK